MFLKAEQIEEEAKNESETTQTQLCSALQEINTLPKLNSTSGPCVCACVRGGGGGGGGKVLKMLKKKKKSHNSKLAQKVLHPTAGPAVV